MNDQFAKGTQDVSPVKADRGITIYAKDFTTVDQGVPIPFIFGWPKQFAGIQVSPIFGFRSEAITTDQGK
jgi:hypothetical protein